MIDAHNLLHPSLEAVHSQINHEIYLSRFSRALDLIVNYVQCVRNDRRLTSNIFGYPPFDSYCQTIGSRIFEQFQESPFSKSDIDESKVVYIATEFYMQGGHTSVVEDFINVQSKDRDITILLTDCLNRFDLNIAYDRFKNLPVCLEICPEKQLDQKTIWLQRKIAECKPSQIYLFNHHEDAVAIAACHSSLPSKIYFYHHADHHLCLGLYVPYFIHLDPHPFGYFNCSEALGVNHVNYIPLVVFDFGARSGQVYPKNSDELRTCSSGSFEKFQESYIYPYYNVIPKLLSLTQGVHIHIGFLNDYFLNKIYDNLEALSVPSTSFIYVPWVKSIWQAMNEYQVGLYINSFPLGGGKVIIEVMGSGTPIINHVNQSSPENYVTLLNGAGLLYDTALTWETPDDLYHTLLTLDANILKSNAQSARSHYEKFFLPIYLDLALQNKLPDQFYSYLEAIKLKSEPLYHQPYSKNIQLSLLDLIFSLEQTQSQLEQTQSQLEIEQTQSQLEQTQSQLEIEQTQSQLERTQSQLERTQSQLERTQSQLERTQSQLKRTQSQLSNANNVISWVQTSKFWKLRSALTSFSWTTKVKIDLLTSYLESLKSVQLAQDIKPPSVLFVTHEASRTGAPIFLINAAKYIKESLSVNCIFLLRNGGEMINEFEKIGEIYVLSDPNCVDITLINYLKTQNIKLIYSNTATNGKVQRDLKLLNSPILCHVHELQHSLEKLFSNDNLDNVLSNTDLFLAGSATVADYLVHRKKVESPKVIVVYPFIDVKFNFLFKKYNHESIFTHSRYPHDRKTLIVGGCGTICWRKGTDLFIQVAEQVLSKTNIPVHFVWVGGVHDEHYYNNLLYDSALMGISEYLFFPGSVSNHLSYLKDFDIFLLPSREDPFPLVMLDSASLEIPIICFDKSGGAKEFIDKNSGCIVPYMDIEAMSNAVVQLLNDKSLRENLGKSAFQKVLAYHDISIGGQQLKSIVQAYMCNSNSLEDLK